MATREKYDEQPYNGEPECAIEIFLDLLARRWKGPVLYQLLAGTRRFSDLRRAMPYVTQRVLTSHLREMERDRMIERTVYAEMPPRVEYSITPLGEQLRPIMDLMAAWGDRFMREVDAKRPPAPKRPKPMKPAATKAKPTTAR